MTPASTFLFAGEKPVHRIGYGVMRLTGYPGNFGPYADWEAGLQLLRRAADLGVQFFDSAWAYGPEWADKILAAALAPYPPELLIATKGGVTKTEPGKIVIDASPATLTQQIDQALINLQTDCIDLFQLHRVDPQVPLADSLGAICKARDAGKVRWIGLSNVSLEQLQQAQACTPIASVQNRYNAEEHASEDALLDYTKTEGIAWLPWGPLGASPMEPGASIPAGQALSWLLERSPNIIAIPGTTSLTHLEENCAALG